MRELDREYLFRVRERLIKFCPICGKELEMHPSTGVPACFAHCDIVVIDDRLVIDVMPNLKGLG